MVAIGAVVISLSFMLLLTVNHITKGSNWDCVVEQNTYLLSTLSVVDCGKPQQPKNGRYIGNLTTFQSSISYECDDGYVLQGSETRMCTSDKNWSGRDVTCSGN